VRMGVEMMRVIPGERGTVEDRGKSGFNPDQRND
jgi:hypothetical protein